MSRKVRPNETCVFKVIGICDPQTCVCARLDRGAAGPDSAEAGLMLAVLRRGIADYALYGEDADSEANRIHGQEAKDWLLGNSDTGWPMSFESICRAFDADPEYVRSRALKVAPADIKRLRPEE